MSIVAVWSALVVGFASLAGCASGGFKLTRDYAGWVNRQNIVLRIVLYILTGVVFAVTMLIDLVIFNTMDFWEGRISQGEYNFNQDGRMYAVRHKLDAKSGLRESKIIITGSGLSKAQEILIKESRKDEIELFVDGVRKDYASGYRYHLL